MSNPDFEIQLDLEEETQEHHQPAPHSKRKGRGHTSNHTTPSLPYDTLPSSKSNYQKSIEGYIVLVTGVHEEASEQDVSEVFAEYGEICNLHLNLNRRTGYGNGYALIEYATFEEAQEAVEKGAGVDLLGKTLQCDFCFVKGPDARRRK